MSVNKPGDHEKLYDFNSEEILFAKAVDYATKTVGGLKDVDPTMPWYLPLYLSYVYDYYRLYCGQGSVDLTRAIAACQIEAEDLLNQDGLPEEFGYVDGEDEELKIRRKRGSMFLRAIERISPASRRKKLSDEEQE